MKKILILLLFIVLSLTLYASSLSLQQKLAAYGIKTDSVSVFTDSKLIVIYMPLGQSEQEIESKVAFVLNTLSYFSEYNNYSIIFKDRNVIIKFSNHVLSDLRASISVQEKYEAMQRNLIYIRRRNVS